MSTAQNNGLNVGNYLLLGRRLLNKRVANIEFEDNFDKYFKDLGLKRYDMMILTPYLLTSDPLTGLEDLEPLKNKNESDC